jgi:hypothetical protein
LPFHARIGVRNGGSTWPTGCQPFGLLSAIRNSGRLRQLVVVAEDVDQISDLRKQQQQTEHADHD